METSQGEDLEKGGAFEGGSEDVEREGRQIIQRIGKGEFPTYSYAYAIHRLIVH